MKVILPVKYVPVGCTVYQYGVTYLQQSAGGYQVMDKLHFPKPDGNILEIPAKGCAFLLNLDGNAIKAIGEDTLVVWYVDQGERG